SYSDLIADITVNESAQPPKTQTAGASVSGAPPNAVAGGISQAFRSDQTPPFPEMLANLFSHCDPNQRAGVLNQLLSSIGPGTLTALPGMASLSSLFRGGCIRPEQAGQVSPGQVQQMAAHAERENPSVVDQISSFYAQYPQVMSCRRAGSYNCTPTHV